ncbi:hypothetical protein DFH06DRAFT_158261 [Mycena polygramma]|nr:hypothetical protein DFH06DRAFT_158261 [Mycena polygramma]
MPSTTYTGANIHAGVVNISSGDIVMVGCTTATNIHSDRQSDAESDYRLIRAGDLHLLTEVGEDEVMLSDRIESRGTIARKVVVGKRKVFRARIFGSQDAMTAIVYEGSHFKQLTAELGTTHAQIPRNPLFLQLFGIAASESINALIYHDGNLNHGCRGMIKVQAFTGRPDLIPVESFRQMHLESPLSIAYIDHQLVSSNTRKVQFYLLVSTSSCTVFHG